MVENKKITKGTKKAVQFTKKIKKNLKSSVIRTPFYLSLVANDLYGELLLAKMHIGDSLSIDEQLYVVNRQLNKYGITLIAKPVTTTIKQSWFKQLIRWFHSFVNKL